MRPSTISTLLLVLATAITSSPSGASEPTASSKAVALESAELTGNEAISTDFGTLQLNETYLTKESITKLNDQLELQRAIDLYQWSLPLTTFQMWYKAHSEVYGGKDLDFVEYASFNEKVGILTANATTPYIISWVDLSKTGPVVIDYPAGPSAGSIMSFYQLSLADLGLTGPDKGKGGSYLVVPPGYDLAAVDAGGAFVVQATTNKLLIGTRFLSTDEALTRKMKESLMVGKYGEKLKPAKFISDTNKRFNGAPSRGLAYFELLHETIQNEPVFAQMIIFNTYLKYLGIESGKPFAPSDKQKVMFAKAANLGELMARANQMQPRQDQPYYENSSWYRLLSNFPVTLFNKDFYYLDESNEYYYEAVTVTKGMQSNIPAPGTTSYLTTKEDRNGNFLSGSRTYKLHLPAGIPASNFWSLTLYSENTRGFIDNVDAKDKLRATSLDSRDKHFITNADGSVDLYVGPKPPAGKESNWLQTQAGEGWFPLFRFYGTQQAFFDKTWKIGEFELMK
jgi:hypothetical protein